MAVVIEPLSAFAEGELRSGAVHSDFHVLTRHVAGFLDGIADDGEGVFGVVKSRGEAAFVTDSGGKTTFLEQLGQSVEHLGTHAQTFTEARSAHRTYHELLESDGGIAVRATIDDVHHRDGQREGVCAANVTVERDVKIVGSSLGDSQRDAEDGVGAELRLGLGAVQGEHLVVDGALVESRHADNLRGDDLVDVFDSFQGTLATVTLLVAVTQLEGFVLASRGA